jgi:hypothetical protein
MRHPLTNSADMAIARLFWFAVIVGVVTLGFALRRIIRVKNGSSAAINLLAHA